MSCLLRVGIGSEEEMAQDSTSCFWRAVSILEFIRLIGVRTETCRAWPWSDGRHLSRNRHSLQRKVALKIIKIDIAERSADARERFMREARAAASLRHENIATSTSSECALKQANIFTRWN